MIPRTVAVVGASANPERSSHHAVVAYRAAGWTPWPVHPSGQAVAGEPCFRDLAALPGDPVIICMYLNPQAALALVPAIAARRPRLVWVNPGADGPVIEDALRAAGLRVFAGCTLVALRVHGDPLRAAGLG